MRKSLNFHLVVRGKLWHKWGCGIQKFVAATNATRAYFGPVFATGRDFPALIKRRKRREELESDEKCATKTRRRSVLRISTTGRVPLWRRRKSKRPKIAVKICFSVINLWSRFKNFPRLASLGAKDIQEYFKCKAAAEKGHFFWSKNSGYGNKIGVSIALCDQDPSLSAKEIQEAF